MAGRNRPMRNLVETQSEFRAQLEKQAEEQKRAKLAEKMRDRMETLQHYRAYGLGGNDGHEDELERFIEMKEKEFGVSNNSYQYHHQQDGAAGPFSLNANSSNPSHNLPWNPPTKPSSNPFDSGPPSKNADLFGAPAAPQGQAPYGGGDSKAYNPFESDRERRLRLRRQERERLRTDAPPSAALAAPSPTGSHARPASPFSASNQQHHGLGHGQDHGQQYSDPTAGQYTSHSQSQSQLRPRSGIPSAPISAMTNAEKEQEAQSLRERIYELKRQKRQGEQQQYATSLSGPAPVLSAPSERIFGDPFGPGPAIAPVTSNPFTASEPSYLSAAASAASALPPHPSGRRNSIGRTPSVPSSAAAFESHVEVRQWQRDDSVAMQKRESLSDAPTNNNSSNGFLFDSEKNVSDKRRRQMEYAQELRQQVAASPSRDRKTDFAVAQASQGGLLFDSERLALEKRKKQEEYAEDLRRQAARGSDIGRGRDTLAVQQVNAGGMVFDSERQAAEKRRKQQEYAEELRQQTQVSGLNDRKTAFASAQSNQGGGFMFDSERLALEKRKKQQEYAEELKKQMNYGSSDRKDAYVASLANQSGLAFDSDKMAAEKRRKQEQYAEDLRQQMSHGTRDPKSAYADAVPGQGGMAGFDSGSSVADKRRRQEEYAGDLKSQISNRDDAKSTFAAMQANQGGHVFDSERIHMEKKKKQEEYARELQQQMQLKLDARGQPPLPPPGAARHSQGPGASPQSGASHLFGPAMELPFSSHSHADFPPPRGGHGGAPFGGDDDYHGNAAAQPGVYAHDATNDRGIYTKDAEYAPRAVAPGSNAYGDVSSSPTASSPVQKRHVNDETLSEEDTKRQKKQQQIALQEQLRQQIEQKKKREEEEKRKILEEERRAEDRARKEEEMEKKREQEEREKKRVEELKKEEERLRRQDEYNNARIHHHRHQLSDPSDKGKRKNADLEKPVDTASWDNKPQKPAGAHLSPAPENEGDSLFGNPRSTGVFGDAGDFPGQVSNASRPVAEVVPFAYSSSHAPSPSFGGAPQFGTNNLSQLSQPMMMNPSIPTVPMLGIHDLGPSSGVNMPGMMPGQFGGVVAPNPMGAGMQAMPGMGVGMGVGMGMGMHGMGMGGGMEMQAFMMQQYMQQFEKIREELRQEKEELQKRLHEQERVITEMRSAPQQQQHQHQPIPMVPNIALPSSNRPPRQPQRSATRRDPYSLDSAHSSRVHRPDPVPEPISPLVPSAPDLLFEDNPFPSRSPSRFDNEEYEDLDGDDSVYSPSPEPQVRRRRDENANVSMLMQSMSSSSAFIYPTAGDNSPLNSKQAPKRRAEAVASPIPSAPVMVKRRQNAVTPTAASYADKNDARMKQLERFEARIDGSASPSSASRPPSSSSRTVSARSASSSRAPVRSSSRPSSGTGGNRPPTPQRAATPLLPTRSTSESSQSRTDSREESNRGNGGRRQWNSDAQLRDDSWWQNSQNLPIVENSSPDKRPGSASRMNESIVSLQAHSHFVRPDTAQSHVSGFEEDAELEDDDDNEQDS
eukprot:ANDGO_06312.mRNA.1 hypothetical protein